MAATGVGVMLFGQHIEMGGLIGGTVALLGLGCMIYRLATRHKRIANQ